MSAKIMGKVWDLVLPPPQQAVLLALADHADHDGGSVKPGVPLIAWKTGYSERQVQRIQKQLITAGLLIVVHTPKYGATEYRIDLDAGTQKAAFVPRRKGDNMTPIAETKGDNMTPSNEARVTSHGKDESGKGDMPSANLSSIRHKDQPSLKEKAAAGAREETPPNAFTVWEQNITLLTPLIADSIRDALAHYPPDWVEDAIRETALSGGKSWRYADSILNRWEREGRNAPRPQATPPPRGAFPPKPEKPRETSSFDANAMVRRMEAEGTNDPSWTPPLKTRAGAKQKANTA